MARAKEARQSARTMQVRRLPQTWVHLVHAPDMGSSSAWVHLVHGWVPFLWFGSWRPLVVRGQVAASHCPVMG